MVRNGRHGIHLLSINTRAGQPRLRNADDERKDGDYDRKPEREDATHDIFYLV
jgi:hypothetical protein